MAFAIVLSTDSTEILRGLSRAASRVEGAQMISLDNGNRHVSVADLSDAEVAWAEERLLLDADAAEEVHGTTDDIRGWLSAYCLEYRRRHGEWPVVG